MKNDNDAYRMDSHKLLFHPREVARWLANGEVYPIYLEISPSGTCNHRCTLCALDYLGYKPRFLDTAILLERLTELVGLGVKSIMYGGEGEPLLHPDIATIVNHTKRVGLDVAITTNGTRLTAGLVEEIAASVSWIRVSLNGGTAATYAALHRTDPADFDLVLNNIATAAALLRRTGVSSCILGVQMVLLPKNTAEAATLAALVKEAGARYLVIKPYSQHPKSLNRHYAQVDYTDWPAIREELASLAAEDFSIVIRENALRRTCEQERGYGRCLALPFWSYIDAAGDVWGGSSYLGNHDFRYGNIAENRFQDIWQGAQRRQLMQRAATELDPADCRLNCRMDAVNHYLWELTHPGAHVNFI
ncbi:MAG: radical SAM protein [Deltaproteobacteria bacterium RIFOXYD12_FULL_57_12]|nr:MAG: radical SAM protein [Deltaproteobacteria bacterium RIFOXYD12_FULL_57_12]